MSLLKELRGAKPRLRCELADAPGWEFAGRVVVRELTVGARNRYEVSHIKARNKGRKVDVEIDHTHKAACLLAEGLFEAITDESGHPSGDYDYIPTAGDLLFPAGTSLAEIGELIPASVGGRLFDQICRLSGLPNGKDELDDEGEEKNSLKTKPNGFDSP